MMLHQTTRRRLRLAVLCVVICLPLMSALAQFSFPQPVPPTVNVEMPPKFSLWEGVDVAIRNLVENGLKLSVKGVINELEAMQRRHEVKLPYQYLIIGGASSKYGKGGKHEIKSWGTRR